MLDWGAPRLCSAAQQCDIVVKFEAGSPSSKGDVASTRTCRGEYSTQMGASNKGIVQDS